MISLLARKVMNMLGGIMTAMKKFHFLMIMVLSSNWLGRNPLKVVMQDRAL